MKMTLTKLTVAAALAGLVAGCGANANQSSNVAEVAPMQPRAERMFNRFDANKDGQITRDEAKAMAAKRFARMDSNEDGQVSKEERQEARKNRQNDRKARRFARMDVNGDNALSMDELKAGMSKRAERRFARLDTNADGGISLEEMQAGKGRRGGKGMRGHGRKGNHHGKRGPMTLQDLDARVMHMFDRADVNQDGVVTLDEADGLGRRGRRG